MKRTFLVLLASALIVSCCKQHACPPAQPPATTKLQGCWFGNYGASICFTDSLLSKDTEPFHAYRIFGDTIHVGLLVEMYTFYLFSDTLVLRTVRNNRIDTFTTSF